MSIFSPPCDSIHVIRVPRINSSTLVTRINDPVRIKLTRGKMSVYFHCIVAEKGSEYEGYRDLPFCFKRNGRLMNLMLFSHRVILFRTVSLGGVVFSHFNFKAFEEGH